MLCYVFLCYIWDSSSIGVKIWHLYFISFFFPLRLLPWATLHLHSYTFSVFSATSNIDLLFYKCPKYIIFLKSMLYFVLGERHNWMRKGSFWSELFMMIRKHMIWLLQQVKSSVSKSGFLSALLLNDMMQFS